MEPACARKSLDMDFRLLLWVFVFLDVVWPLSSELDVVNLFGRSFVSFLWVWAEDVLFGEAGERFWKLENSFEIVWEV